MYSSWANAIRVKCVKTREAQAAEHGPVTGAFLRAMQEIGGNTVVVRCSSCPFHSILSACWCLWTWNDMHDII